MLFRKGDICINAAGWSDACYVITDVHPSNPKYQFSGIHLVTGKLYKLIGASLVKIGETLPDLDIGNVLAASHANPPPPSIDSEAFQRGKERAEFETYLDIPQTSPRWRVLANAKPGDWIRVHSRGQPMLVKFHHVLARAEKYCFLAETHDGKLFRYPLDALILDAVHEAEIHRLS